MRQVGRCQAGPLPDQLEFHQLGQGIPDLEIEQPQRNDNALQDIADQTNGYYFENINLAMPSANYLGAGSGLTPMVQPRDQETYLPGTTDQEFSRKRFMWILGIFTLVLCLEWTLRRLNRLA